MDRRTTIGLVAAFGVLLLYVLLVQRPREQAAKDATATPGSTAPLWSITTDQVASVWLVDMEANRGGAIAKDSQGIWQITAPSARAADQIQAASLASRFAGLTVSTRITSTTDLAAFGVLNPKYTFGVKLTDGTAYSAAIGDKTPTGTGYYVLREGEVNVAVVNSGSVDLLLDLLNSPPYVPTPTPTPTPTVAATPDAAGTAAPTSSASPTP